MVHKTRTILAGATLVALAGCQLGDPNAAPEYGETSGLPKNCRAIVQANVDGYRSGQFTADEVISSLERNCGAHGYSWGHH